MSKYFKKADFILCIALVALSILGFLFLRSASTDISQVEISVSGKVVHTYALMSDHTYTIETDYGYNTIEVKNGQVWVTESNCPNKDCMNFGKIHAEGEVILCLPHELAIRIVGGEEGGSDATSY